MNTTSILVVLTGLFVRLVVPLAITAIDCVCASQAGCPLAG